MAKNMYGLFQPPLIGPKSWAKMVKKSQKIVPAVPACLLTPPPFWNNHHPVTSSANTHHCQIKIFSVSPTFPHFWAFIRWWVPWREGTLDFPPKLSLLNLVQTSEPGPTGKSFRSLLGRGAKTNLCIGLDVYPAKTFGNINILTLKKSVTQWTNFTPRIPKSLVDKCATIIPKISYTIRYHKTSFS